MIPLFHLFQDVFYNPGPPLYLNLLKLNCILKEVLIDKILIDKGNRENYILLNKMNRHGLISGATGTGKTVTLKVLTEDLYEAGVPTILADVKGDLANIQSLAR